MDFARPIVINQLNYFVVTFYRNQGDQQCRIIVSSAPSSFPEVKATQLQNNVGSEMSRKLEEHDTLHKFYKKMCILPFIMGLLGLGAIFGLCYLVVDLMKVSNFEI